MSTKSQNNVATRATNLDPENIVWYSPWKRPFYLAGMGWPQEEGTYRRMPLKPEWQLPEGVDLQAWHTSGIQARFRTNAERISVRVKLHGPHSMDHCAATGQCGVDAYIGETGAMTFAGVARFNRSEEYYQTILCNFPTQELRTVTLNMPLYQGVHEFTIGLPPGSRVSAAPRLPQSQRVVIYGTSITQGGCACRPGMSYTNILSRRINAEFINLGFSGSGRGEPEVAHTIATMRPPALFIADFEANCSDHALLCERLPVFLEIIRKRWPRSDILVISKVPYAREAYDAAALANRLANRDFQKSTVARLRRAGDKQISFFDGSVLLGEDYTECSVDGVHQTDLGFIRIANHLEGTIKKLLQARERAAKKTCGKR